MAKDRLKSKRNPITGTTSLIAFSVVFLLFYLHLFSYGPTVSTVRLKMVDGFYQRGFAIRKAEAPSALKSIVIASIDHDSIRRVKERWPWRRSFMARFLDSVKPFGPRVVGFDLSLSVPGEIPEDDILFARVIQDHGHVVLGSYFADDGRHVGPIPLLAEAASSVGFLNMPRDYDGVSRRVHAAAADRGVKVYAFGVRVSSEFLGVSPEAVAAEASPSTVSVSRNGPLGSSSFPFVQASDPYFIPYGLGGEDFDVIPMWHFFEGKVDPEAVRDKIILVGATGEIFHDQYATPLGVMPGVIMHAHHVLQHLESAFIRLPRKDIFYAVLVALMGLFALVFSRIRAGVGLVGVLILVGLSYEMMARLFQKGILLDPLAILVTFLGSYVFAMIWRSVRLFVENVGLKEQASRDGLTGLYTYRHLEAQLMREFDRARDSEDILSFVIFDLDRFKEINDRYGHEQGNEILVQFAKILRSFIRGDDLVARYGGEEFCLVLPRRDREAASLIADRVRASLKKFEFTFKDKSTGGEVSVRITVSAGICSSDHPDVFNGKELLRLADQALLEAKRRGRDRVLIHGLGPRPPGKSR